MIAQTSCNIHDMFIFEYFNSEYTKPVSCENALNENHTTRPSLNSSLVLGLSRYFQLYWTLKFINFLLWISLYPVWFYILSLIITSYLGLVDRTLYSWVCKFHTDVALLVSPVLGKLECSYLRILLYEYRICSASLSNLHNYLAVYTGLYFGTNSPSHTLNLQSHISKTVFIEYKE
jgi:hypothetical protein